MTDQYKAEPDVCLCVVFNHAFPKNISNLRRIYSDRFSNIKFIIPFFRSDEPDIITVYRGSYTHAAFITDAHGELLNVNCSHYIVVQDDVLLAPRLNEKNILDIFKLGKTSGFIGEFLQEAADIASWGFWPGSLWRSQFPKNLLSGTGVESWENIKNSLPSYTDAKQKLAKFGIGPITLVRSELTNQPLFHNNPFGTGILHSEISRFYSDVLRFLAPNGSITLDYPFVTAGPYSDFYIVPKSSLREFSHISGVLSAAGIFTEITIPTALALSVDDLVFKKDAEIELDWVEEARNPEVVLDMFASNPRLMAMHPVKLSLQSNDFIAYISSAFSQHT
jgi:hypothetical protein